jgi:hypothetical protein
MSYTNAERVRGPADPAGLLAGLVAEAASAVVAAGEHADACGLGVPAAIADAELALWQWYAAVEAWLAAGRPPPGPALELPGLAEPGAERQWQGSMA